MKDDKKIKITYFNEEVANMRSETANITQSRGDTETQELVSAPRVQIELSRDNSEQSVMISQLQVMQPRTLPVTS